MPRFRLLLAPLVAAIVTPGCAQEEPPTPRAASATTPDQVPVKTLLARLQDPDAKARDDALMQISLRSIRGFAPRDGVRLIREAARRPPGWPYAPPLIEAVATHPGPDDIPAVLDSYKLYPPEAKAAALDLLARLPDRDAAEAIVRLLRAPDPLPFLRTGTLDERPRHADVFFPALFDHLDRNPLRPGLLRIAAAYADAGLLEEPTLRPFAGRFLAILDELLDGDRPEGLEEPADRPQFSSDLFDLLAHLPDPATEAMLRRALASPDPDLVARSALTLLQQGLAFDPDALDVAAADPLARHWLWGRLQDSGRTRLLPERFRTQEALAGSEMAYWFDRCGVPELTPTALEPMGDYPAIGPLGRRRVYLFRFRVSAPENLVAHGWMAGWVSYPPDQEPALGGDASSHFTPFDDLSPQGHVAASQDNEGSAGAEEE